LSFQKQPFKSLEILKKALILDRCNMRLNKATGFLCQSRTDFKECKDSSEVTTIALQTVGANNCREKELNTSASHKLKECVH